MKERFKRETAVGVLFVLAMMVLGYYTIIMSKKFIEPPGAYRMSALFPSVEGLDIDDKVKVNGVEAGKVAGIELQGHEVLVVMSVHKSFTLYENFLIKIRSDALLGRKFVSIVPGTPLNRDGFEQGVIAIRENLPGTYEDPFASISEVIDDNRDNIYASIRNLRQITEKINSGKGTLGKLINEDKIHAETDDLVRELRESIEDSREQAPITSFIRAALTAF